MGVGYVAYYLVWNHGTERRFCADGRHSTSSRCPLARPLWAWLMCIADGLLTRLRQETISRRFLLLFFLSFFSFLNFLVTARGLLKQDKHQSTCPLPHASDTLPITLTICLKIISTAYFLLIFIIFVSKGNGDIHT